MFSTVGYIFVGLAVGIVGTLFTLHKMGKIK